MKVLNNHESHWIKDIEDHTHPRERHLEVFKVIGTQKAKKTKKYVLGKKCRHMISRCRHLKIDLNLEMKCRHLKTVSKDSNLKIKVSTHVL